MKEHPMLFSKPMILALLAGTKTETRRLIAWQGPKDHPHFFDRAFTDNPAGVRRLCVPHHHPDDADGPGQPCERHYPRWEKGDRIWAREAWKTSINLNDLNAAEIAAKAEDAGYRKPWAPVEYSADRQRVDWDLSEAIWPQQAGRQRSARFMPRWASRLTLDVIEEPTPHRLQDISEDDARAEGVIQKFTAWLPREGGAAFSTAREAYRCLWDDINGIDGPASWGANPWVWRIPFRVLP